MKRLRTAWRVLRGADLVSEGYARAIRELERNLNQHDNIVIQKDTLHRDPLANVGWAVRFNGNQILQSHNLAVILLTGRRTDKETQ